MRPTPTLLRVGRGPAHHTPTMTNHHETPENDRWADWLLADHLDQDGRILDVHGFDENDLAALEAGLLSKEDEARMRLAASTHRDKVLQDAIDAIDAGRAAERPTRWIRWGALTACAALLLVAFLINRTPDAQEICAQASQLLAEGHASEAESLLEDLDPLREVTELRLLARYAQGHPNPTEGLMFDSDNPRMAFVAPPIAVLRGELGEHRETCPVRFVGGHLRDSKVAFPTLRDAQLETIVTVDALPGSDTIETWAVKSAKTVGFSKPLETLEVTQHLPRGTRYMLSVRIVGDTNRTWHREFAIATKAQAERLDTELRYLTERIPEGPRRIAACGNLCIFLGFYSEAADYYLQIPESDRPAPVQEALETLGY